MSASGLHRDFVCEIKVMPCGAVWLRQVESIRVKTVGANHSADQQLAQAYTMADCEYLSDSEMAWLADLY